MTTETLDAQVNLRLPSQLKERIEAYSQLVGRSENEVAVEALNEYLTWRVPQIEDLEQAIAAADRNEFATAEETAAVFAELRARVEAQVNIKSTPRE